MLFSEVSCDCIDYKLIAMNDETKTVGHLPAWQQTFICLVADLFFYFLYLYTKHTHVYTMRFCFLFILYVFLGLHGLSVYASWECSVVNYTRHDYRADNQNWMIDQQDNGWIYVANNKGLLEFDGVNWTLYSMRGERMRALKRDDRGHVYVGGISNFGYFRPDRLGKLRYTCLSDSLPVNLNMGTIRNICVEGEITYFQADRHVFIWQGGKLYTLDHLQEISASGIVHSKFYIVSSRGLWMLKGSEAVLVDALEGIADCKALLPYKDKVLLVTRGNGIYMYGVGGLKRIVTRADVFLQRNGVSCATMCGTLLAVGTLQGGVCLLDLEQDTMEVISTSGGLQDKTVQGMLYDAEGNLWLGLASGVDYVRLDTPVRNLYGNRSPIGSGYASCVYQGKLYLGTIQGVYRTNMPYEDGSDFLMDFIEGAEGQNWSFLEYDGKLFCALDKGVVVIDRDRTECLEGLKGVRRIIAVPGHPDALLAGAYGVQRGLHVLRKSNGRWLVVGKVEGCDVSCKNLLADSREGVVWIANRGDGIFRLRLSADMLKVEEWKEYTAVGLNRGRDVCLAYVDEQLAVASRQGLWLYDEKDDSLKRALTLEGLLGGKGSYTFLQEDALHNLWYSDGKTMNLVRYDASRNVYSRYSGDVFCSGQMVERFESVTLCGNNAVIGSESGFSLLRLDKPIVKQVQPVLQIRKVFLTGVEDSLVYGQSYLPNMHRLVIPYRCNSLRIEYGAADYGLVLPVSYSYKLSCNGKEGEWSEYGVSHAKEFTNLSEGNYVFSVRLPDLEEGMAPVVASFEFEILPPWYRTWWSYLIYIVVVMSMLYYFYHWITKRHIRVLKAQEQDFYHRQQALQQESNLKDEKIDSLKEENLQAELRHKSEELIRTTLNIVRKNEMLQEIRKEVVGISHSINEENLVTLRRKTLRLIGHIDTNIEHDDDLQAFQSTFDSVHHDFFKRLEAEFPELNNKEKMLCAYINMNLLSKEIAPLLNISVRGVEISRYRLRKKLRLNDGENLSEFLQRFSR